MEAKGRVRVVWDENAKADRVDMIVSRATDYLETCWHIQCRLRCDPACSIFKLSAAELRRTSRSACSYPCTNTSRRASPESILL
jgi:hypothetical protein